MKNVAMTLIEIRTFASRSEAEVAQGALAAAGIESVLNSDDAGGAYPFPLTGSSASLLVEEADAAAAAEILGNGEGEDEGGEA
jgi:putative signal transducing protein